MKKITENKKIDLAFEPKLNVTIHKDIRYHPDLTYGEKFFLAEMMSLTGPNSCEFSSRKLSSQFNVSHQTVINWIKKLVRMDYLEITSECDNTEEIIPYIRVKKKKKQ